MVRFAAAAIALAVSSFGLSAHAPIANSLAGFLVAPMRAVHADEAHVHSFEQASYPIREIDTTRDSNCRSSSTSTRFRAS